MPTRSQWHRYSHREYMELWRLTQSHDSANPNSIFNHTNHKITIWWLYNNRWGAGYKEVLEAPFEDMLLYINDFFVNVRLIARWRLRIGR
jgi:hypothetical protein